MTRSRRVAAPALRAQEALSDLPSLGERSLEQHTGGRWTSGAPGPAVGARCPRAERG